VDDEEDEDWKDWGRVNKPEVEPNEAGFDLGGGPVDVASLMTKQARGGPQLAFARLVQDPKRTKDEVEFISGQWTSLLRTGGMADTLYPVDESTILISITDGKFMDEIKEFVLGRPEAYEFEWKNQKFRRPGDPPIEPVKSEPGSAKGGTDAQKSTKSHRKKKSKKVSKKTKNTTPNDDEL